MSRCSSSAWALVALVFSLVTVTRAVPSVPSSSSATATAYSRMTLSFPGTADGSGDALETIIVGSTDPDYGTLYTDEGLTTTVSTLGVTTACANAGNVTGRRLTSQTAYYVAPNATATCDTTETRRTIVTSLTYRLIDVAGNCSDESSINITVKVFDASLSRFVRACKAMWVTRSEDMNTIDAVDWWNPNLTLPLTGTDAENNGQFMKQANSSSVVYGWGDNGMKQLSLGDDISRTFPETNTNFAQVKQFTYIAATLSGETVFGIEHESGYVWGWGYDARRVLGLEKVTPSASTIAAQPVRIGSLALITKLAAGAFHVVAMTESGKVYTWGADDLGQLGRGWMPGMLQSIKSDSFKKSKSLPARVVNNGFRGVVTVDIASGEFHTLALTSSGDIWAWGSNIEGQLGLKPCEISKYGNGLGECRESAPEMPYTDSPQIVAVGANVTFSAIAAGARYSMALTAADETGAGGGRVFVWGYGEHGQLGLVLDGRNVERALVPQPLTTLGDEVIVFIAAGESHVAAIASTGELYTWGSNTFGQLGHGDRVDRGKPTKVQILSDANIKIHSVSCGRSHTVAVSDYGEVFTWGSNEYGQLGTEPRPADDTERNMTLTLRGWSRSSSVSSRRRLLAVYGSSTTSKTIFSAFSDFQDASGRSGSSNAELSALVMGAARPFKGGYVSKTELGLYGDIEYVATPVIVAALQQVTAVVAAGGSSFALRLSCNVGYERDITTGRCTACSAGSYTNDFTSFACQACPVGQYQDGRASSSCKLCEAGQYAQTTGSSACSFCAAGKFVPFEGSFSSIFCEDCPRGTKSVANGSQTCTPCAKGEYQDSIGQSTCKVCPAGTFNDRMGSRQEADCVKCPPGTFAENNGSATCTPCPAGFDADVAGASACQRCALGKYSPGGQPQCTPCPVGTSGNVTAVMTSVDECVLCALGFYMNAPGAEACLSCEVGTYSDTQGAAKCTPCPVGYEAKIDVRNGTSLGQACQVCGTGKYNAIAGGSCTVCNEGTYQDQTGQSECKKCPIGKEGSTAGAQSIDDCVNCAAGYESKYEGMVKCTPCAMGFYGTGDRDDTSACQQCPAGTYSQQISSTTIEDCEECPAGFFSQGDKPCEQCPAGQYQANTAQSSCDLCPAGTYLESTGAKSEGECLPCNPGTFSATAGSVTCTQCAAGSYAAAERLEACVQCPVGTISTVVGSQTEDDCLPCPAGSTSDGEGKTTCTPCAAGSYRTAESAECVPCPAGTYSNVPGASSEAACLPCPAGSFSNLVGQTVCTQCAAGTYQAVLGSTECVGCPAGTSSGVDGAETSSTCQPCAPGTFSDVVGSFVCDNCVAGTFMPTAGNSSCINCPAGTYSTVEGSSTASNCLLCTAGQYSLEAATTCADCDPGSYAPNPGTALCDACPAGTYGDEQGGTNIDVCLPCPIGRYSSIEGAQECLPCPAGKFGNETGLSECYSCLPGTFSTVTGAVTGDETVCTPCATGTSSFLGGKSSCTPCDPGTYADVTGSINCTKCGPGTYGVAVGATKLSACKRCPLYRFNSTLGSSSIEDCVYYHSATSRSSVIVAFALAIVALAIL